MPKPTGRWPVLGTQGTRYRALCQDCLHVQHYADDADVLAGHQERTHCEKCNGAMCACHDCLLEADKQEQSL